MFNGTFNCCCMLRFSITARFRIKTESKRASLLHRNVLKTFFLRPFLNEGVHGVVASPLDS